MSHSRRLLCTGLLVLAMAPAGQPAAARQAQQDTEPKPRPDLVRYPYTAADVDFMAGMIPHHAQAIVMAKMAPTHAASPELKLMCERMLISQRDEIEFMRNWLRDRGQVVPAADATHHRMKMNGVEHDMLMPGMLSKEELTALEQARGREWDRLFLNGMIKHHEGAIKMVDALFASHGALQDEDVYQFATDIYADQTSEIERMQKMLAAGEKRVP